jgi:hypothetical protein
MLAIAHRGLIAVAISLTTLAAPLALTTPASASRSLSLTPGGGVLAISLGLISFRGTIGGIGIDVTCSVTLHGSVSRVIPKVPGTLAGTVTSVLIGPFAGNNCNRFQGGNTVVTPLGLPWLFAYLTFTGTLPSPSLIIFHSMSVRFNMNLNGITPANGCEYSGLVPFSVLLTATTPNTTAGLTHILRHRIPLSSTLSPAGCPNPGELIGLFNIQPRQTVILVN